MAKRKTNSYWLSLIAMLLVASMVLSIGDTQARYVNTTVWNTVVYPTSEVVFSDCLRPEGQTILLGEMEREALEITFLLESTQDVSGTLEAVVDLSELVQVELSHEKVELEAYEFVTVTMTLIPTEMAINAVRPEMDVDILVTWGDMLSGTFRVTLPELTEEDLGIEPSEPEETEPEVTEPEVTEPEATEPEVTEPEVTEPEATEPEVTEPEATEPEPTETEPTEPNPTETEATEPEKTPTETTAPEANQPETEAPAQTPESSDQSGAAAETSANEDTSAEGEALQQVLSMVIPQYMSRAAAGRSASTSSGIRAMSSVSAPSVAGTDAPASEPTENTSGEVAEISENGDSESDPTEESTASTENTTVSTEESTASTENTTASTQETTASTEESSDESAESQPDGTTQSPESGDSEQDTEQTETGVTLGTVESFDPAANLPLLVTPGEDTTLVRLGLGVIENGVVKVAEFPAFTRYSLDSENYFMLYFGGVIELDTAGVESKALLLDLNDIGLNWNQDVVLAAEAYDGSKLLGTTSTYSVAEADIGYSMNTRVMTDSVPTMILTLPDDWKSCHLDYAVTMLVSDQETGYMSYEVVELGSKGLKATHLYGASSPHQLMLELGEEKPLPGTYRLSMSWTYEGICFARTQTTFFITYSGSR